MVESNEYSEKIRQEFFESRKLGASQRNFTYDPGDNNDKDVFIGCNQYCEVIGEGEVGDEFALKRNFRNGRTLYFCTHPKARRLSDGTLRLCIVYDSRQSPDLVRGVKSGNIRQKHKTQ